MRASSSTRSTHGLCMEISRLRQRPSWGTLLPSVAPQVSASNYAREMVNKGLTSRSRRRFSLRTSGGFRRLAARACLAQLRDETDDLLRMIGRAQGWRRAYLAACRNGMRGTRRIDHQHPRLDLPRGLGHREPVDVAAEIDVRDDEADAPLRPQEIDRFAAGADGDHL